MRVLPNVHDALRQNDPKTTSFSQPVVKKAPPTLGRARPSAFYSDAEPPRIGSVIQPPPPAAPRPAVVPSVELPLAATPMTPSHPPRPPISALPKHPRYGGGGPSAGRLGLAPMNCRHHEHLCIQQSRQTWMLSKGAFACTCSHRNMKVSLY